MSRGVGAALVAAAVVLSGCGSAQESVTTTSPSPETPVNPWDLPLEERPALFDPCAEIPVEAVEEALGGSVEPIDLFTRHQPGGLMVCGWASDEVDLTVLSTWKSRADYLEDSAFTIIDSEAKVGNRNGLRALDNSDAAERGCTQMFFTSRGTIWVELNMFSITREFHGERSVQPCTALNEAAMSVINHLPEGDFS